MAASAGRVLLIPKGTYNAATTYNMLDVVYYDGATYVCKQTSLGNLPTDTDYWQLMASSSGTAAQVSFDPTGTGLEATNVQDAVEEVNEDMQYLYNNTGGKNRNVYPYSDTTKSSNGIIWTDIGDGTVRATGGTSGTYSRFELHSTSEKMYLSNGTYIFSGCPSGGGDSTYSMFISYTKGGATVGIVCSDSEVQFTIDGSDGDANGASVRMGLDIEANVTLPIGGVTFSPMIRNASIADNTYVPYAMTNRELTELAASIGLNNFDAGVSILPYTSSSPYVVPVDGYFAVGNNPSIAGYGWIGSASNTRKYAIGGNKGNWICPVKKGMQLWVSDSPSLAYFSALI